MRRALGPAVDQTALGDNPIDPFVARTAGNAVHDLTVIGHTNPQRAGQQLAKSPVIIAFAAAQATALGVKAQAGGEDKAVAALTGRQTLSARRDGNPEHPLNEPVVWITPNKLQTAPVGTDTRIVHGFGLGCGPHGFGLNLVVVRSIQDEPCGVLKRRKGLEPVADTSAFFGYLLGAEIASALTEQTTEPFLGVGQGGGVSAGQRSRPSPAG